MEAKGVHFERHDHQTLPFVRELSESHRLEPSSVICTTAERVRSECGSIETMTTLA